MSDKIIPLFKKEDGTAAPGVINTPAMLRELAQEIENGKYPLDIGIVLAIRQPDKLPKVHLFGKASTEDAVLMLDAAKFFLYKEFLNKEPSE